MTTPKHFMGDDPYKDNATIIKEYAKQRKDRMQDAIDDYLSDERVTSRQVYEEMLSCIDDVIQYHKAHLEKAQDLQHLMLGHRLLPEMDELATKWHYDKIPSRY